MSFCMHISGVTCDNCRSAPTLPVAMPGPFKCPDCSMWWAGFAHRCAPATPTVTIGTPFVGTSTYSRVCTCPANRGDNYYGTCPVHDVTIT